MMKDALQRDRKAVQVRTTHPAEEGSTLEMEKGWARSFVFLLFLLFKSCLVRITVAAVGRCNTWMDDGWMDDRKVGD